MANWTKADLAQDALERLGIVGAGESPAAEDTNLVESVVDSVYPQLRKDGLVPFAVSAIPDWAQRPLSKIIAGESAAYFGISGQRLQIAATEIRMGRRQLVSQMQGGRRKLPIRARFY